MDARTPAPHPPEPCATSSTPLRLVAADGRALAATIDAPAEGAPRASVVIAPALGVPARTYARFARHLAARGIAVLRVDLRGVGGSADRPLRQDPATLEEWGRFDIEAALAAAADRWPAVPRWALGHSFGGQALGMCPSAVGLAGVCIVAAGVGDLRLYTGWKRLWYTLALQWIVPLIVMVWGYGPRWLQLGEPMPAGVLRQWGRWTATPDYLRGALPADTLVYDQMEPVLHFFEIEDDTMVSAASAARLRAWYSGAQIQTHRVRPAALDVPGIGHFGFFRAGPQQQLWDLCADAMVESAPPSSGSGSG